MEGRVVTAAARVAGAPVTPVKTVRETGFNAQNVAGTRRRYKYEIGHPQETNVFITINTNLKTRDDGLAAAQLLALRDITAQMLASEEILKVLDVDPALPLSFHPRAGLRAPIRTRVAGEFGPIMGSIHSHASVFIKHESRIFFNRAKIKHFIKDRMNAVAENMGATLWMRALPNVQVKLLQPSDYLERIERYMNKTSLPGEKVSVDTSF